MSENWLLQHSVKIGGDMVNLRGDNPEQFKLVLDWAIANAALFVNVAAALNSVPPALAGNVTHTQVQSEPTAPPAPPQGQPAWGAPQQQAPSWSQPATAAPSCRHGERTYREGTGAKGPWKAYFCPSKNRADQCDAQWIK